DLHFNREHRTDPLGQNWESYLSGTPVESCSTGAFQIFTVPSRLSEAIHSPSGLNATLSTQLVRPWKVRISSVPPFQTFTAAPVPPQASTWSSLGWNDTLCTAPVGSGSVYSSCHV